MNGTLIVVGGGRSEYRGYILQRISRRYRLVLFSPQEPTWERRYIDEFVKIAPGDDRGIIAAAVEFGRRRTVHGVVTYHEACVELVAKIGSALGVPQCEPVAAARCRDKFAAREAMRSAGVPTPRYELVQTMAEARSAAAEIGYPVVVKPRGLTASFGVSQVAGPAQMDEAFDRARANAFPEPWDFRPGILVEEYLDGPEFSVDCACWQGRTQPVIFARKVLGYPPYFEELGHLIGPASNILPDAGAVSAMVVAAHQALGIDNTVTHTEIRLTPAGPRIIEVNGRLGGDVIPLVAETANGLNLPLASADIATGAEPDLGTRGCGIAGIRFFYATAAGRVMTTGLVEGYEPDWLRHLSWLVTPGEEIRPVPARLHFARTGYAIVTAESPEQCGERMAEIERNHVLQLEPLDR
jgi:biotin carboxylase